MARLEHISVVCRKLERKDQRILQAYCDAKGDCWTSKELQGELGMSANDLRVRLFRILKRISKDLGPPPDEWTCPVVK